MCLCVCVSIYRLHGQCLQSEEQDRLCWPTWCSYQTNGSIRGQRGEERMEIKNRWTFKEFAEWEPSALINTQSFKHNRKRLSFPLREQGLFQSLTSDECCSDITALSFIPHKLSLWLCLSLRGRACTFFFFYCWGTFRKCVLQYLMKASEVKLCLLAVACTFITAKTHHQVEVKNNYRGDEARTKQRRRRQKVPEPD